MILITRPKDKAFILESKLSKYGYECYVESLSEIKIQKKNILFNKNYVYLITSPRTANCIINYQKKNLETKFLVIGLSTCNKLKQAGFKNVIYGAQDSDDMIRFLKKSSIKHINYLTGTVRNNNLPTEISKMGISLKEDIIYVTNFRRNFSKKCISLIKSHKISRVLIYSKANAQHFIDLIDRANIKKDSKSLVFVCLSKKIAEVLGTNGYSAHYCSIPTESSLIKKLT